MVTTRSAEKRLAASGRVEELVVRPKVRDIASSPTPSSVGSKKRTNITVNIPTSTPKRVRLSNNAFEVNSPDGYDDSPYVTAKESPESIQANESGLTYPDRVVHVKAVLQTPRKIEIPSSQETFISPVYEDFATPVNLFQVRNELVVKDQVTGDDIPHTSEPSAQDAAPSSTMSGVSQDQAGQRAKMDGLPTSRSSSPLILPTVNNLEEVEAAPEVFSSKRLNTPSTMAARRRKHKMSITPDKTAVSSQTQISDNKKDVSPINGQPKNTAVLNTYSGSGLFSISPGLSIKRATEPDIAAGGPLMPSFPQSQKPDTNMLNPAASGNNSKLLQLGRYDTNIRTSISSKTNPRQMPFSTSRLPAVPLPNRASNTLERYRQGILHRRVTRKQNRHFRLTTDWSAKRRKFVTARYC